MDRRKVNSREAEVKLANWVHVGKGHDLIQGGQTGLYSCASSDWPWQLGVEHDLQPCGDTRKECYDWLALSALGTGWGVAMTVSFLL